MIQLLEYTSTDLLKLAKNANPERFDRRKDSGMYFKYLGVNIPELTQNHNLDLVFIVKDYKVRIRFLDFYKVMYHFANGKYKSNQKNAMMKAIKYAYKHNHILVDCQCSDYKFRYKFVATKKGFAIDNETRPAKITNPHNKGGLCKHLMRVLNSPSVWIPRVVTTLTRYVKVNHLIEDDDTDKLKKTKKSSNRLRSTRR